MKVLGRSLVPQFDDFWEQFRSEVSIPLEYVEEGHSLVFGGQGLDLVAPEMPAWAFLPTEDLSYHIAHEIAHIILRERRFPSTSRGPQYPENSEEARVGSDLEEMVLHRPVEELLSPFDFKKDFIQNRVLRGASKGLTHSPIPERGTLWFYTWAIRYCELKLDLPQRYWRRLETIYETRSPEVCELGKQLVEIMYDTGWNTKAQTLGGMIRIRDILGLDVESQVLVINPESGQVV